jgi:glucose-1-phosphate adenylyltransferase
MSPVYGQYIDLVPAQMRTGQWWYQGTADAIYQNLNLIEDENADIVAIFGGDHIFKMDIRQMLAFHRERWADLTIAAIPVPVDQANQFGILEVDEDHRVIGWAEKPKQPKEIPGRPGWCLASMGNYVFQTSVLIKELQQDARSEDSYHDFGHDVITSMYRRQNVYAYDFHQNAHPGMQEVERGYWRDVGTMDAYYESNMDLVSVNPTFNLYNPHWPIRTYSYQAPPCKFVFDDKDRRGSATDSLVSDGCIVSGGRINRSILSPHCRLNSYSEVDESILLQGVVLGRHVKVQKAIIDKFVEIPAGMQIGVDKEEDVANGFYVSPGGITVVAKQSEVPKKTQAPVT